VFFGDHSNPLTSPPATSVPFTFERFLPSGVTA
jgi:hypothetical protein